MLPEQREQGEIQLRRHSRIRKRVVPVRCMDAELRCKLVEGVATKIWQANLGQQPGVEHRPFCPAKASVPTLRLKNSQIKANIVTNQDIFAKKSIKLWMELRK